MPQSNPIKILIVDDDALIAASQMHYLRTKGYDAISKLSGESAIEFICEKHNDVDLILMDVDLGKGIDGFQTSEKILKYKNIPIIFVSSHTDKEIVERTEKISSYGYLVKGVDATVLDASVKMALKLAEVNRINKEQTEHLNAILQSLGEAVISSDLTGNIIQMNAIAEKLTEWEALPAYGKNVMDIFVVLDPETRIVSRNFIERALNKKENSLKSTHQILLSRSGREYQIEMLASPIKSLSGQVFGVVFVFRDVTLEYANIEKLKQNDKLLNMTQRMAKIGSISHDLQGKNRYFSKEAFRIFEVEENSTLIISKEDFESRFMPEDFARLWHVFSSAIKDGVSYSIDHRIRTASGRLKHINVLGEPVRDKYGNITHYQGQIQDITERKENELRLQLAANVFTHAREGILIADENAKIIDVNETFCQITGYSKNEVIGKNPKFLKSGRHATDFYEQMWHELEKNGHWFGEIWNRRKNGDVYPEMETISVIKDETGKVTNYLSIFNDIGLIKDQQRHLEHIAHFDALTGLPNRILLGDRLSQAISQCDRNKKYVAVVFLDLDGFKSINDEHGHDVGDQLLIAVAKKMKVALRECDTVARLGGDEFVAVLADLSDPKDCEPVLYRLLAAASDKVEIDDFVLKVSASIGVTVYPQDGADSDQLMRHADQAMYIAKQAGKNRFHMFDVVQDEAVRFQIGSRDRIQIALEKNEFLLYYQPKVNMRTGEVIGAEGLIRWQHPEKGLLTPSEFLYIIEDHSLSERIGEYVINSALNQMTLWKNLGIDIKISVNISARHLQQIDFVKQLKGILGKFPLVSPKSLQLEILETSALEDIAKVSSIIDVCQKIGIQFAIDDFGTGYSSLTYLKRLRAEVLKIDQSFVRDMIEDNEALSIIEGVISLAKAFRREVIAEGVETIQHGEMLLKLGCECGQGYGIARPMHPTLLPEWIQNWKPHETWY